MKKLAPIILFTAYYLLFTTPVLAQLGTGVCGPTQLDTALGCIDLSTFGNFATWLISWGVGIAGGISLILILVNVIIITTSSGDPKKMQAGQEGLTAAVTGLLLVIMAIFILRVIGYDIFKIPGLSPTEH